MVLWRSEAQNQFLRIKVSQSAELAPWGGGGGGGGMGGAHIRDLICVTELGRLPVLLLCLVEAALRTGSLHQRWGQVDGGV